MLDDYKQCGYVLADVRDPQIPILYPIEDGISISVRCYEVAIGENEEDDEYELLIRGTYKG